ncbi:MAG: hypothetical protein ACKO3W_10000 [bacterium]
MSEAHEPNDGGLSSDDSGTSRAFAALCEADQRALDILIEHGFDLAKATAAHPGESRRLAAAHSLFARLESYETEPVDESLVDLTLARIAREDAAAGERMRIQTASSMGIGGGRWHDFIAVACAAILLFSIGAPIFSWMSNQSADRRCAENLRQLGAGIASYVTDHNHMPIAAGFAPDLGKLVAWKDYRNGKHLSPLVAGAYCDPSCTACGNDETGEGYAYQVPTSRGYFAWLGGFRVPAVADRNPVIDLVRRGRSIGTYTMNSPEHGGRGQNILFTDGSIEFDGSPVITLPASAIMPPHSENIWLPMDAQQIEDGLDAPIDWTGLDIFLMQ